MEWGRGGLKTAATVWPWTPAVLRCPTRLATTGPTWRALCTADARHSAAQSALETALPLSAVMMTRKAAATLAVNSWGLQASMTARKTTTVGILAAMAAAEPPSPPAVDLVVDTSGRTGIKRSVLPAELGPHR